MSLTVKLTTAAVVAGIVLAGCSSSPDTGSTGSGAANSPATVEPTAAATQTPPEPTAAAQSPELAADDPYCELVAENQVISERVADAAMATELLTSSDTAAINEWGAALAADSNAVLVYYADAPAMVDDAPTVEALAVMHRLLSEYTIPLAEAAAEAGSLADLTSAVASTIMDADIQELVQTAPAAATTIREYNIERCGEASE